MNLVSDPRFWFWTVIAGVWIYRSWRAIQTLARTPVLKPHAADASSGTPLVSIIIPAKNEEANISECLNSLLGQDYPNFEILVVNDNSSDRTESILKSFGTKIRFFNAPLTPEGWTGKNFAIHTALSKARKGLLFCHIHRQFIGPRAPKRNAGYPRKRQDGMFGILQMKRKKSA